MDNDTIHPITLQELLDILHLNDQLTDLDTDFLAGISSPV